MSKTLISIIIPTYKRNQKLKKIIDCLAKQCPLNIKIEVIIVCEIYKNLGLNFNYLTKKKIFNLKFLQLKKIAMPLKETRG